MEWSVAYAEKRRSAEEIKLVSEEMNRAIRWLNSRINECSVLKAGLTLCQRNEAETGLSAMISQKTRQYRTLRHTMILSWTSALMRNKIPVPILWNHWAFEPGTDQVSV